MSNILIKKSEDNLNSAKKLHDNKYYNSSVHCSYYSVYQHVLYIVKNFNVVKYEMIEKEAIKNGNASHFKTLKFLVEECLSTTDIKDHEISLFNRSYNILKTNRLKGDYSNEDVTENASIQSIQNVDKLKDILNQFDNG